MLVKKRDDKVVILTIDRPQRRNALGTELVLSLRAALSELDADPEVHAIVLTGSAPGFCAGSDLKELATMNLQEMCKPVVCAVSGFSLGGGFALAAACDLVVTSEACRWHMPEVQIGWIPPWGLQFLLGRCTAATARRLAWGVEPINGAEACRLGLADYTTADDDALPMAMTIAHTLAKLPAPAVAATKRYFRDSFAMHGEIRDAEANLLFAENCSHPVAKATLAKFGVKA